MHVDAEIRMNLDVIIKRSVLINGDTLILETAALLSNEVIKKVQMELQSQVVGIKVIILPREVTFARIDN